MNNPKLFLFAVGFLEILLCANSSCLKKDPFEFFNITCSNRNVPFQFLQSDVGLMLFKEDSKPSSYIELMFMAEGGAVFANRIFT